MWDFWGSDERKVGDCVWEVKGTLWEEVGLVIQNFLEFDKCFI